jgi:arginase
MHSIAHNIEIISAPSILGFRPTGGETLAESLLASGLAEILRVKHPVIHVPTLNALYSDKRDRETNCLNPKSIRDFSFTLGKAVSTTIGQGRFPCVLGGDCSILIGIMPVLKASGCFGLIFLDAHADFYEPEKSITGEVADMDLAIITGRGPEILTNIHGLRPYVQDENVIHIGQRDWEETRKYGSQDILETQIKCFDAEAVQKKGAERIATEMMGVINNQKVEGYWIHFDTDVLSDEVNPAVDYRLPGGLLFEQVEYIIKSLLTTGKMAGLSVTIFNPKLDQDGYISRNITQCIGRAFD